MAKEGMCGEGGHGGMCGKGGACVLKGESVAKGGMHGMHTPVYEIRLVNA